MHAPTACNTLTRLAQALSLACGALFMASCANSVQPDHQAMHTPTTTPEPTPRALAVYDRDDPNFELLDLCNTLTPDQLKAIGLEPEPFANDFNTGAMARSCGFFTLDKELDSGALLIYTDITNEETFLNRVNILPYTEWSEIEDGIYYSYLDSDREDECARAIFTPQGRLAVSYGGETNAKLTREEACMKTGGFFDRVIQQSGIGI